MTATPRRRTARPTAAPTPSVTPIAEFVRWSRVETARARVAAGWYERAEVKDALVAALLEELRRR